MMIDDCNDDHDYVLLSSVSIDSTMTGYSRQISNESIDDLKYLDR